VIPVCLFGVAILQRAQGGVGLDHARVDPQAASEQEFVAAQGPQHHLMHRLNRLQRQSLPDHREAALLRGRLGQVVAAELADRTAVVAARSARPLLGRIVKEPDDPHLEVSHRIDPRPPPWPA
jgi:hypothetical protein